MRSGMTKSAITRTSRSAPGGVRPGRHGDHGQRCAGLLLAALVLAGGCKRETPAAPAAATAPPQPPIAPLAANAFDAAPFAVPSQFTTGTTFELKWAAPRKVRRVVVEFGDAPRPASPEQVRVQYWHHHWNGTADPAPAERDPINVGWDAEDDWFAGTWRDVSVRRQAEGKRWTFAFNLTGPEELPGFTGQGVRHRRTLRLRLVTDQPVAPPTRLRAITGSFLRPLAVRVEFGQPAPQGLKSNGQTETGRLEVFNGGLTALRAVKGSGLRVTGRDTWSLPAGANGALEADLLLAEHPTDANTDRTVLTVRSSWRPFSVAANEVARGDRILVDDLGVLVTTAADPTSLADQREDVREDAGQTIYRRVFAMPEQQLARAWTDMPLKRPLYYVHGLPGNRNAMQQLPNGSLLITRARRWFERLPSAQDSARKLWPGDFLGLMFGLPPDRQCGGRRLLDGYLPQLTTWWYAGSVFYEQTTMLDSLSGDLADLEGDEPTVLLMRVRMVNTGAQTPDTATLCFTAHHEQGERLRLDGDQMLGTPLAAAAAPDQRRLRYLLDTRQRGTLAPENNGVRWTLALGPGESHEVFLTIPSVTLTEPGEIAGLRQRDHAQATARLVTYWRTRLAQGTQLTTPEPWLNDFWRAHLQHELVNCVRERGSNRLHAHVGTFSYGVFPSESAMMIVDLDRRGHHEEAARCLESFLNYQGTVPLPGRYATYDGVFYGAGGHEDGGYNQSHGWVMWAMAQHWWLTRDRSWLDRAAPQLVRACAWVANERSRTRTSSGAAPGARPREEGLLPPGRLEDVQESWHWLVNNVYTAWGLEAVAGALADSGHPEAARWQTEARDYRQTILQAFTESRVLTPVVRLRDGTYVPKYPSRLLARGRGHGWLRETLEGALPMVITGLLDPQSPEARWILEDYEDNLYVSREYGYDIPAFDRFWFSRGGFSMQANLLAGVLPYLYRDEVKHFLRGYFNAFTSAFYPEVRMLNEHSTPELGYPGGDHFKTSDEAQSISWLRQMFVREQGRDLYLGQALPRAWLADGQRVGIARAVSYFGPVSWRLESQANSGTIVVHLEPPTRTPPARIILRLRHPAQRPLLGVTLNGQEYRDFVPDREWIILPGSLSGPQTIVARY